AFRIADRTDAAPDRPSLPAGNTLTAAGPSAAAANAARNPVAADRLAPADTLRPAAHRRTGIRSSPRPCWSVRQEACAPRADTSQRVGLAMRLRTLQPHRQNKGTTRSRGAQKRFFRTSTYSVLFRHCWLRAADGQRRYTRSIQMKT